PNKGRDSRVRHLRPRNPGGVRTGHRHCERDASEAVGRTGRLVRSEDRRRHAAGPGTGHCYRNERTGSRGAEHPGGRGGESEMSEQTGPEPTVCPKCRSTKVSANSKISAHTAHHATHLVKGVGGLVLAGALWLAAKGMNAVTHDWKCNSCNHEFSQS